MGNLNKQTGDAIYRLNAHIGKTRAPITRIFATMEAAQKHADMLVKNSNKAGVIIRGSITPMCPDDSSEYTTIIPDVVYITN